MDFLGKNLLMKRMSEKIVYKGQWLDVLEIIYENQNGHKITWEVVKRKKSSSGVIIVTRLMPSKKFILIKQFRPPIGGYILSFPAGLGSGDPEHALVELKEETGYTGKIMDVSPILKAGSSLIDDNAHIVYVEVDESDPLNQNPLQNLEPAEDITVCLISKQDAKEFFFKEHRLGTFISSNLWYLFGLPPEILSETGLKDTFA